MSIDPISQRNFWSKAAPFCVVTGSLITTVGVIAAAVFSLHATTTFLQGTLIASLFASPACVPILVTTCAIGAVVLGVGLGRLFFASMADLKMPLPTDPPFTLDELRAGETEEERATCFRSLIQNHPNKVTIDHFALACQLKHASDSPSTWLPVFEGLTPLIRQMVHSAEEERINALAGQYGNDSELGTFFTQLQQALIEEAHPRVRADLRALRTYEVAKIPREQILPKISSFDPSSDLDVSSHANQERRLFLTALYQYTKKEVPTLEAGRFSLNEILREKLFPLLTLSSREERPFEWGQRGVGEAVLLQLYQLYFGHTFGEVTIEWPNEHFTDYYNHDTGFPVAYQAGNGRHFWSVFGGASGQEYTVDTIGNGKPKPLLIPQHRQLSAGGVSLRAGVFETLEPFPFQNLVVPVQQENICYLASAWLVFCAFLHYHEQIVERVRDGIYRENRPTPDVSE